MNLTISKFLLLKQCKKNLIEEMDLNVMEKNVLVCPSGVVPSNDISIEHKDGSGIGLLQKRNPDEFNFVINMLNNRGLNINRLIMEITKIKI